MIFVFLSILDSFAPFLGLLVIIFNNKMKNKQAKQNYYRIPESSPTKQKNSSSNQFGNIINRVDLISRSPTKKAHELTSKKKKDYLIQVEENSKQYENQELATFYIPNNQQNQQNYENNDNWVRKEGGCRRRQYDMRLGNIQKMSSQITNLLDLIKNNEHKKVTQEDEKNERSLTPTRKTRAYQQQSNQKHGRMSYIANINDVLKEDSTVTQKTQKYEHKQTKKYEFITEGAKQKNKSRRKLKELEQENKEKQLLFNKTSVIHKSYIENKERIKEKSPSKKYNYNERSEKTESYLNSKLSNFKDNRPASSMLFNEQAHHQKQQETSRFCQTKKYNKDLQVCTSKLETSEFVPKYSYNYDSPALKNGLNQINKSEYTSQNDGGITSGRQSVSNFTNIDDQISKIKSRIQCSEQKTRKMEEKYLFSDEKQQPGKLYHRNDIDEKLKKKHYEASEQFKKINQQIKQTEPTTQNFQIKIYPCQSNSKQKVINTIAQKLAGQIKLDQNLRVCRQKFGLIENADKWIALKQLLNEQGVYQTQEQLREELTISSSEYNPFTKGATEKPLDYIQQIAESFIRCEQFWKKDISGCVKLSDFEKSGFKINEIDLDKKGCLSVQDFVCFVNLNSSNFFRNRDVVSLYRRFMSLGRNKSGVEYEAFQNKICYK